MLKQHLCVTRIHGVMATYRPFFEYSTLALFRVFGTVVADRVLVLGHGSKTTLQDKQGTTVRCCIA